MTVGIIGLGFVGGSMLKSFKLKNIECKGYDKYKNIGSFEEVLDTNILFLCLQLYLMKKDVCTTKMK